MAACALPVAAHSIALTFARYKTTAWFDNITSLCILLEPASVQAEIEILIDRWLQGSEIGLLGCYVLVYHI